MSPPKIIRPHAFKSNRSFRRLQKFTVSRVRSVSRRD